MDAGHARQLIAWLKDGPAGAIRFPGGSLRAVTAADAGDGDRMEVLASWHREALSSVPGAWPVDAASVRRWLRREVLQDEDRLLFWVYRGERPVGHIGIEMSDIAGGAAFVGDTVGEGALGLPALEAWARRTFGLWLREPGLCAA